MGWDGMRFRGIAISGLRLHDCSPHVQYNFIVTSSAASSSSSTSSTLLGPFLSVRPFRSIHGAVHHTEPNSPGVVGHAQRASLAHSLRSSFSCSSIQLDSSRFRCLRRIALGSSIEWLCWINQLPIDRGCNSHLEIELVSLKRMPLNNISLQWICCCLAPSSVLLSSSLPTLCSLFPTHAPEIHI